MGNSKEFIRTVEPNQDVLRGLVANPVALGAVGKFDSVSSEAYRAGISIVDEVAMGLNQPGYRQLVLSINICCT